MNRACSAAGLAAAAIFALAGGATAADLPLKAMPAAVVAYGWSGCYAGVNVGGGWGRRTGDPDAFGGPGTLNALAAGAFPPLNIRASGATGGGQVGCNWQSGNIVWGAVTDIQGSSIHGSGSNQFPGIPGLLVPIATNGTEQLDWFGTVRGRLGFAATNDLLLYVTGGLAYGHVENSLSIVGTPPSTGNFLGFNSSTRVGWTAGAGGELALGHNWTAFGEFLVVDLGSTLVRTSDPNNPAGFQQFRFDHQDYIARVGVNWHFGNPIVGR